MSYVSSTNQTAYLDSITHLNYVLKTSAIECLKKVQHSQHSSIIDSIKHFFFKPDPNEEYRAKNILGMVRVLEASLTKENSSTSKVVLDTFTLALVHSPSTILSGLVLAKIDKSAIDLSLDKEINTKAIDCLCRVPQRASILAVPETVLCILTLGHETLPIIPKDIRKMILGYIVPSLRDRIVLLIKDLSNSKKWLCLPGFIPCRLKDIE